MKKNKLTKTRYNLLQQIVHNVKCFDKKDNTFLLSNRATAKVLGVSRDSVDRLFRDMKDKDLVRVVANIFDQSVWMLDPEYLFYNAREEKPFNIAMFQLGGHEYASQWREWSIENNIVTNVRTGKPFRMSRARVYDYASRYSMFDRCYRKGQKIATSTIDELV